MTSSVKKLEKNGFRIEKLGKGMDGQVFGTIMSKRHRTNGISVIVELDGTCNGVSIDDFLSQ